jgi:hypothetical protein
VGAVSVVDGAPPPQLVEHRVAGAFDEALELASGWGGVEPLLLGDGAHAGPGEAAQPLVVQPERVLAAGLAKAAEIRLRDVVLAHPHPKRTRTWLYPPHAHRSEGRQVAGSVTSSTAGARGTSHPGREGPPGAGATNSRRTNFKSTA